MPWISHLSAAFLFLLLLPCFPGQNGGENEQSTDVISVWEGDSISITCSRPENEVGIYLNTLIQPINVFYLSEKNDSYTFPAWNNRIKYSKEERNLRITLQNVQESDSNIYVCTKYFLSKGHHKTLKGKTTIVVVKAKVGEVVEQSPLYASPQQSQSVSITCALRSSHEEEGIYLLKTHMQPETVLYVSRQNNSTISSAFADRLNYSKEEKKIVVTLNNLQENDSGIYLCAGMLKNAPSLSVSRSGTIMLIKVKEAGCSWNSHSSWGIYGLATMVVLLFSALMCSTLYHVNIKKSFQKKNPNAVYEDMSYSSRRNTLVRTNTYSAGN
ncbi:CD7 protein, partial [Chionis minor]|nr:CD7 protein [Chionis minor]